MKTILRLLALTLCLIFAATFMVACDKGTNEDDTATTTAPIETTAAVAEVTIDEDGAKEIAFADAGIPATAAENLSVTLENGSYIVAFEWSGFSYQYTINGATGEITDSSFN